MTALRAPELLLDVRAELAESPVWDPGRKRLLWVDILASNFWEGSLAGEWSAHPMPSHVGSVHPATDGSTLVVLRDGFHRLEQTGKLTPLSLPLSNRPELRFNDGKCDPLGRAFAGTMPYESADGEASLFRLDQDGAQVIQSGMRLANGLGWSPKGERMYLIDSGHNTVFVFDYDLDTGRPTNRRVWLEIAPFVGMPDGLTVDQDGCVWIAMWGGSACHRYTPDGRLDLVVHLPVSQPTSMCFAETDLKTIIITSAAYGLTPNQLASQPLAGGLFALDVTSAGLPVALWNPLSTKKAETSL